MSDERWNRLEYIIEEVVPEEIPGWRFRYSQRVAAAVGAASFQRVDEAIRADRERIRSTIGAFLNPTDDEREREVEFTDEALVEFHDRFVTRQARRSEYRATSQEKQNKLTKEVLMNATNPTFPEAWITEENILFVIADTDHDRVEAAGRANRVLSEQASAIRFTESMFRGLAIWWVDPKAVDAHAWPEGGWSREPVEGWIKYHRVDLDDLDPEFFPASQKRKHPTVRERRAATYRNKLR